MMTEKKKKRRGGVGGGGGLRAMNSKSKVKARAALTDKATKGLGRVV